MLFLKIRNIFNYRNFNHGLSFIRFLYCFFLIFVVNGCATSSPSLEYLRKEFPEPQVQGVYHKVKKGETIWRIAKAYNISQSEIVDSNNIPNVAQVEENQLIFIPGAYSVKEIVLDEDDNEKEFIWPVKGKVIKYFHSYKGSQLNKGIDIKTQEGEVVKASRKGRVVFADQLSGYGYTVILDHLDGFYSSYSHNSKLLVKLGEMVNKNNKIARVGISNNLSFLHFEIRKHYVEDNPLHYLP